MVLNRKELKKITHSFNSISSRMMRVSYDEYNIVLKKFITFIDSNDLILDYINTGYDSDFDVESEYKKVVESNGELHFDFGSSMEEESYRIYETLKYILKNDLKVHFAMSRQYRGISKFQEIVKEFNNRVLLVLINNIEDYLTKVGIDMGLDENMTFNVSGGQVNISNDNSTINATQNNGVEVEKVDQIIKNIKENLKDLSSEDAETVVDAIDMVRDEIAKPEPKGNIISSGIKLLSSIITTVNGIPILANNLQLFIDLASKYIH